MWYVGCPRGVTIDLRDLGDWDGGWDGGAVGSGLGFSFADHDLSALGEARGWGCLDLKSSDMSGLELLADADLACEKGTTSDLLRMKALLAQRHKAWTSVRCNTIVRFVVLVVFDRRRDLSKFFC